MVIYKNRIIHCWDIVFANTVCLINAPCFGILLFMRFKMCQSSAVQRWIDLGECASVVRLSEHLFSFQFLVFSFSWRVRRSVSKPVIASQPDQSQLKWAPTDWKRSKLKGLSSLCDDYQMEVVAMFNISLWCQGEAAVSCPVFIATRLQNIKEASFFMSFISGCPAIFSLSCQEILGQKLFTPQKRLLFGSLLVDKLSVQLSLGTSVLHA